MARREEFSSKEKMLIAPLIHGLPAARITVCPWRNAREVYGKAPGR